MQNEKYKGKIFSFYELLASNKIEIPIIQRDYAQGRKDKKKIRQNFLEALYDSIDKEEKIMLDFVYGSNTDDAFQPLDGQQRLTTLFLLHWYAAQKDKKLVDEKNILIKFTYETRISSRDFCNSLVENSLILTQDSPPSETIIDSPWFYLSWKNDPTIDAMLRTIDDIHLKFYNTPNLWYKLTSKEFDLIRFYHVELENIGLTDDLYIKMNARGKLLSTFENFKAGFEKRIRDEKWESFSDFTKSFAFKIDTTWTDLFWKHFRKDNAVDTSFVNFISTLLMIRQSVERNKKTEERLRIISKLQEDSNNISPKLFEVDDFNYLVECLNLIDDHFVEIEAIKFNFPLFRHEPKESLIKTITLESDASYTQKVLLFAQLEYFRKVKIIDTQKYLEWMRVVRNIISRGDIEKSGKRPDIVRSPATFDGVIYLISELSTGCKDIYGHLSNISNLSSTFAKEQVEEEKFKAKIIFKNPDSKKILFELEDTDLLRGRIDFIFYCLDIDKQQDSIDTEFLEEIKNVFIDNLSTDTCLTNDLRRALLTISVNGRYEFYHYWWSFWNVVDSDKRRLIDKYREIEYLIHSEFSEYFKILIHRLRSNSLKEIVNNFNPDNSFPNWKLKLIKEENLLNENGSNYIAISQDNSYCYLLKSKRPRDKKGCIKIE
ncbi:DUF262 domain-containing protein [Antarcticibacterium sp. 1MA-6-2]|uniref:DUF262 domain-containing protein n=1 Tax=Antarcticibacterium sp. 1MA-6-2 TaxID=2908210 RepID=UPI001F488D28|nr:DUF262 domain-containing protein [Antarcticibacterium sp. 1MA-6-2]UJH92091.1 DUF262 domain-containing protein [Antarcticibacterium sp. 1MA-6-2]